MSICVLDDDPSLCRCLERVLRSAHFEVCSYQSQRDFFRSRHADEAECLVLDVAMPEGSGLEVQEALTGRGIPIVFLSGRADVATAVRAMKAGAIDFLPKPFDTDALLEAVERGLARRRSHEHDAALRLAYSTLTCREREVFVRVVGGMLNKQIGFDLRIAEKTVKVHRARVLEKMGAASLAHLVRMADRLGIGVAESA